MAPAEGTKAPAPTAILPTPTLFPPQAPPLLVVIDAGHGGAESGAALGDIAEKDFNLGLARRLRAELEGRGFRAILLRDGDNALSLEQRTLAANSAHASAYIGIHAAASGAGVHVYASDLPPKGSIRGFLPFATAQAAYVQRSEVLAGGIVAELNRRGVAAVAQTARLRPLNSVAAPAVVIEVGPPAADAQGFSSTAYQQSICSALAGATAAARPRLEMAR